MKIKPQPNIIQLKINEATAGDLNTTSKLTAVEFGEVIAIGADVKANSDLPNVGDKVFFKSWAVDIVTHNGITYYFIDVTNNGILAIVN